MPERYDTQRFIRELYGIARHRGWGELEFFVGDGMIFSTAILGVHAVQWVIPHELIEDGDWAAIEHGLDHQVRYFRENYGNHVAHLERCLVLDS